jgi:hypothetical protein
MELVKTDPLKKVTVYNIHDRKVHKTEVLPHTYSQRNELNNSVVDKGQYFLVSRKLKKLAIQLHNR